MELEAAVARHYGREGLERAILDALSASGTDIDRLTASDLSAADEFHLGWRAATEALANDVGFSPGTRILDLGCGLGGPARLLAERHGCHVVGIDLTREYVGTAAALSRRCGLADRTTFLAASALALPFGADTFAGAILLHVGMNIEAKERLFGDVQRVLRSGSRLGIYDVMRVGDGPLPFPVPWSATAATSFVERPDTYQDLLRRQGFIVERVRDRSEMVLELAREMRERAARHGSPAVGLHLIVGPAAADRIGNVMRALERGIVAPIEIIASAP